MSVANLHTLLSGPLYINEMYGASLVPSIYKSIVSNSSNEKSIENLILERQSISQNTSVTSTANKVVVVDFTQPVLKFDYGYWLGTKTYTDILKNLEADESVAGVVLNIDSGGGQVYGTPEFYDFIKNYSKPIVSYTDGYMCSGAYYIAAGTQKIFANKRADAVGSIGAYATIVDTNGILEHFGGKVHTVYATKSTEKNSDYRNVLEKSDYEGYVQNQLDPIVDTFIADMLSSRPNLNQEVFKGGTWTGEKALEMGLVDQNGTIQDAINYVFELSSSINQSNNNMSKNLPKVEACLGLTAPLASTDNGSYLNETQLGQLESSLETLEVENSNLQTQLTDSATANETAVNGINEQLTEAKGNAIAIEASVDKIMSNLGLAVEGSITEKIAVINAKSLVIGKADGASHTNSRIDVVGESASTNIVSGVDISEYLNN